MSNTVTGNSTFDFLLSAAGALVPLLSIFAGFFNGRIRAAQAAGETIAPGVLKVVAGLNVLAVNIDKARQLAALARDGMQPKAVPGEACQTCGQVVPAPDAPA